MGLHRLTAANLHVSEVNAVSFLVLVSDRNQAREAPLRGEVFGAMSPFMTAETDATPNNVRDAI